ncbi:MAG: TonB family protein [Flavobacteriales bacterium]|nr:TonB family protein [Flavobacteriales bacterium]
MKSSKAPLEKKRPLLLAAGLMFALSVTLVSFEWRTPYVLPIIDTGISSGDDETVWIPITLQEPTAKVEKPALPKADPIPQPVEITEKPVTEEGKEEPKLTNEMIVENPNIGIRTPDKEVVEPVVVEWAPVMPEYCTGEEDMMKFLGENLTYPRIPLDNGVSGVVIVEFVVDKNGNARDAKVVRSVDPWLDAEALRVAKMLECFHPGMQGGQKLNVYLRLPIRFSLAP